MERMWEMVQEDQPQEEPVDDQQFGEGDGRDELLMQRMIAESKHNFYQFAVFLLFSQYRTKRNLLHHALCDGLHEWKT